MINNKIQSFTDLNVWKEGHKLVLMVYKVTASFPQKETYSIVDQMRRAASSITANIAEGFGRQTYKEKLQFYYISKGSLSEAKNFLFIARDVDYLNKTEFDSIIEQLSIADQLLQGLIRKTRTLISH